MEVNLFCLILNSKRYIILNTEYLYIGNIQTPANIKSNQHLPITLCSGGHMTLMQEACSLMLDTKWLTFLLAVWSVYMTISSRQ